MTLDLDHIERRARLAVADLEARGCAEVSVAPGDMTCYTFLIQPVAQSRTNLHVTLAASWGRSYQWDPTNSGWTGPDYCAEKWCEPGRISTAHTAEVVAAFLNALRPLLTTMMPTPWEPT